ncbi:12602_t:CDS:1, partial [Dentiscutata heterogama]
GFKVCGDLSNGVNMRAGGLNGSNSFDFRDSFELCIFELCDC